MDRLTKRDVDIILSFQVAWWSHVFPDLRLVSIRWTEQTAELFFYVNGQISDDDFESLNLIHTYFSVCFSGEEMTWSDFNVIRIDYPSPIASYDGECVFARKELPPLAKPARGVLIEKDIERRDKVLIAMQRAMINHVIPQLRMVSVNFDDVSAIVSFYVDGRIGKDDVNSFDLATTFFCMQFPKEEMEQCEKKIVRLDFPKRIEESHGELIYLRKEAPELSRSSSSS
jgi:hypothetical protein